ncbi:MAG: DUF3833 domain-containing protein [Sedimenticolaceae bacterium]
MTLKTWLLLILFLVPLGGCSVMQPKDFDGTLPHFDLFAYFEGETRAWGIFQDRSGNLKRQFTVDIRGEVEGEELTLTEDFAYADGEVQQRIWRIRRLDAHRYEGRADDVVGTATGLAYGNALNWRYTLRLPFRGSELEVKFDDWMFLQGDDVLVNRATVSKFGFTVGEVTLFFTRGGHSS